MSEPSASTAQFPAEQSRSGDFVRQESAFRHRVVRGDPRFPVETGRYHLYVSLACPWAHRTVIARRLLGLEDAIGVTVVDPLRDERGWAFREGRGHSEDDLNGFRFLSEAYRATDPDFESRVTVPVLWDRQSSEIVNNESSEILRMLSQEFTELARTPLDLYPQAHRAEIDEVNEVVYGTVNNGVYRAGFATSQAAYDRAVRALFHTLDRLDARLAERRYLVGPTLTEADIRLYTTLVRFDHVYHGHFKCNLRRIVDLPNLSGYLRDLFQTKGFGDTTDFDHIVRHYYLTHERLNPSGIVPIGPQLDLTAPHGREALGG
ncbi:MAG: glutathione S-transferase family protein [Planctomycetota bacterium]